MEGFSKRVKTIAISELKREINIFDIIVLLKLFFYRFKHNPDVVHLHSSKIGVLGRIAFSPFKTIYTVHGFDSTRVANRKFLFWEKILKFWCKYIVGVSKYDFENLLSENITGNVSVIYNGVKDYSTENTPDFSLAKLITEKRKQFKYVIMSIARDDAPKRPDLFAEIAKNNPEHYFAAPNKYFESLLLRVPLITTKDILWGDKVVTLNTGYALGETLEELNAFFNEIAADKDGFYKKYNTIKLNCQQLWQNKYANYHLEKLQKEYLSKLMN